MTDSLMCPVVEKDRDTGDLEACGAATYRATALCARHYHRLGDDLATIGRLRVQLDPAPGRSSIGTRGAGKPGSRPPANLTVIAMGDTRSHFALWHCGHQPEDEPCPDPRCGGEPDPDNVANVDADLLTEARWVIEQRRLNPPMRDVFDSLRILNIHLDWICSSDRVDEFAAVLAGCARGLRTVLRDWPDPAIGKCPDIDPHGERDRCGGPLRWIDGSTAVACTRCGSTWAEADLPHILRVVSPDRRFPVPRAWASVTYNVAPATLRQWIRRGHVRSYSDEQVELFDVLARVTDTPMS